MTAKQLKPLDLSIFLTGWTFVGGTGDYRKKQACIMSALYLAVRIAEGKTTLDKVLSPYPESSWGNKSLEESDRVTCVSDALRDTAINVNDSFDDDAARTKWAVEMLPRLPGTKLGQIFDRKLDAAKYRRRHEKGWVDEETGEDRMTNERYQDEFGWILGEIATEKSKRATALEKRRATLAAKKAVQP